MFTFISIADSWIYLYPLILCFLFTIFFYYLIFFQLFAIVLIEFVPFSPLQCFGRYIFYFFQRLPLNFEYAALDLKAEVNSSDLSSPILLLFSLLVSPDFKNLSKLAIIIRVVGYTPHVLCSAMADSLRHCGL